MVSRAVPYNIVMRTTLPCSANAASYHGLSWQFQMQVVTVTAAMLQVDRATCPQSVEIQKSGDRLSPFSRARPRWRTCFPRGAEIECETALAAVSAPRRRRLDHLERDI